MNLDFNIIANVFIALIAYNFLIKGLFRLIVKLDKEDFDLKKTFAERLKEKENQKK